MNDDLLLTLDPAAGPLTAAEREASEALLDAILVSDPPRRNPARWILPAAAIVVAGSVLVGSQLLRPQDAIAPTPAATASWPTVGYTCEDVQRAWRFALTRPGNLPEDLGTHRWWAAMDSGASLLTGGLVQGRPVMRLDRVGQSSEVIRPSRPDVDLVPVATDGDDLAYLEKTPGSPFEWRLLLASPEKPPRQLMSGTSSDHFALFNGAAIVAGTLTWLSRDGQALEIKTLPLHDPRPEPMTVWQTTTAGDPVTGTVIGDRRLLVEDASGWHSFDRSTQTMASVAMPAGQLYGSIIDDTALYAPAGAGGPAMDTIMAWDVSTGATRQVYQGSYVTGGVYAMRGLALVMTDHATSLLDLTTGRSVQVLDRPPASLAVAPDRVGRYEANGETAAVTSLAELPGGVPVC